MALFVQETKALKRASALDYSAIADQITTKKAAEVEIEKQNIALKKAKGDKAKEAIKSEIDGLMDVRKHAAEQALWLTMRADGIIRFADNVPILNEGKSVLRSKEKGTSITWIPIFADTIELPLHDENDNFVKMRDANPDVVGNTASNGISRILPEAFSSPEMLASVIVPGISVIGLFSAARTSWHHLNFDEWCFELEP